MYQGIGVSSGIAIARAVILDSTDESYNQMAADPEQEKERFFSAVAETIKHNQMIFEKSLKEFGQDKAEIFLAHLEILEDEEGILEPVVKSIEEDGLSAEAAVVRIFDQMSSLFSKVKDDYLRERAVDFMDVKKRLLSTLCGVDNQLVFTEPAILFAHDLTPSDTAQLDLEKVKGIVIEAGARTSHTAILAQAMELPAVVGMCGILGAVYNGQMVIIDGENGTVYIEPDQETVKLLRMKSEEISRIRKLTDIYKWRPTVTSDNVRLELYANIGDITDADKAAANGAEGIGLFRSEFLFLGRDDLPDEEEQFAAYKSVLEMMPGKSVVVRTLDIGGDKDCPSLELEKEENSFLGLRAIRFCLQNKDLFMVQLRALARASAFGNCKVMFPMISHLQQFRQAKELFLEALAQVKAAGHPTADHIDIGIMVEIPSTAVMADVFAKEVDFFSIGSNDLTQYTAAVDRGNAAIAQLYSNYEPGMLRLVYRTIQCAKAEGIMCGMCGEAAGDLRLIPFFVGCGLQEFSMTSTNIAKCRAMIAKLSKGECEDLTRKVLTCGSSDEVLALLQEFYDAVPDICCEAG